MAADISDWQDDSKLKLAESHPTLPPAEFSQRDILKTVFPLIQRAGAANILSQFTLAGKSNRMASRRNAGIIRGLGAGNYDGAKANF